jgi:hypothetical protein
MFPNKIAPKADKFTGRYLRGKTAELPPSVAFTSSVFPLHTGQRVQLQTQRSQLSAQIAM